MEKCYSTNEEEYKYDTLEEAAEYVFDNPDLPVGTVLSVFEGEPVKRKPVIISRGGIPFRSLQS